ncbi:MAG: CBS domain-containing protein [Candidatus Schekmanbacteria bacterium]|nr:CBS domain-containing protein [Candidatus Schekmanbacteria bacterium]
MILDSAAGDIAELLSKICIAPEATIRDAMEAIARGGLQISLVVDGGRRLVGTVTDGDIRVALLADARMNDPIGPRCNRAYTWVHRGTSRAEIIDLMKARSINQVPILDDDHRLVGLQHLQQLIGIRKKPNWAVIMAGGRGQRLQPLTDTTPKPMLRVAGRPILERLILHLVGYGVTRIFLAVSYKADVIESYFGAGERFGCHLRYLKEQRPLGTGGGLALLPEAPEHPLLVLNGDLITQFDVEALLEFHRAQGAAATVGVGEYQHLVPYGVLTLEDGRVSGIAEKPLLVLAVNAGIYVLEPHLLARIPADRAMGLPDVLADCLDRRERVAGYRISGDWMDLGTKAQLELARGAV